MSNNQPLNPFTIPQGPQPAPPMQRTAVPPQQLMATALMVALSERKAETNLRVAFIQLCEERHKHFHEGHSKEAGTSWLNCGNSVCQAAREILKEQQSPQVVLNPISFELYRNYGINVSGAGQTIFVKLVTPDELPSRIATPNSPAPQITLTDADPK